MTPANASAAFSLYANCIPVKGARRSIVCDIQNGRYRLIPNGLYEILTAMKGLTVEAILQRFTGKKREVVESYFVELEREEYGAFQNDPSLFPAMDLSWDHPGQISNAIIDIDGDSNHNFRDLFEQLDALGCEGIQIRAYSALPLDAVESMVVAAERRGLRSLELLLCYAPDLTPDALRELTLRHGVLSGIIIHSSPRTAALNRAANGVLIVYHTQPVRSADCCGEVAPVYFSAHRSHFTEARVCNSCLNRKVSITTDGEIRNCPSMTRSFGRADLVRIADVVTDEEFRLPWSITKDQISICRDCEFRYICTDCRAYLSAPDDPLSKPAKCNYDPYTATWPKSARASSADTQPGIPS